MMANEERKEKQAPLSDDAGSKSETDENAESIDTKIERARKVAAELKAENDRKEDLMAREALGGKSDGPRQPEERKPMTDKEYKDYFLQHGKPPEGEQ